MAKQIYKNTVALKNTAALFVNLKSGGRIRCCYQQDRKNHREYWQA
jgi:hypothetical protein